MILGSDKETLGLFVLVMGHKIQNCDCTWDNLILQ